MSTNVHVALVPRVEVPASEVSLVAAALSIQVARDFGPIWGISATVSAFPSPADVPVGYWPIYIMDPKTLPPDEGGVHLDRHKQPYALIKAEGQWSIDASHECLEMLVDPAGNKLHANRILDQAAKLGYPPRQVQYLVEVCDPIEDPKYGYDINGVLVSDFLTPHFYDPMAAAGVRYDFTGALSGPREVLDNGYISWIDPADNRVMQLTNFADDGGVPQAQLVDLSEKQGFRSVLEREALRPAVDRVTHPPEAQELLTEKHRSALEMRCHTVTEAARAHERALRSEIDDVLARHGGRSA